MGSSVNCLEYNLSIYCKYMYYNTMTCCVWAFMVLYIDADIYIYIYIYIYRYGNCNKDAMGMGTGAVNKIYLKVQVYYCNMITI